MIQPTMKPKHEANEIKSTPTTGRSKPSKERPWLWMEKAIVRTIRDVFDATNDVSSALAVSVALAEIGSDEQSDTFTKSIREIAGRAGVSYKSAARILSRFEALKIIAVERNSVPGTKEHAPSTYTLRTLGNHYPTLGNDRIPPSFPRIMNNKKESKKNDDEEHARADARVRETAAKPHGQSSSSSAFLIPSYAEASNSEWKKLAREFKRHCENRGGSPTEAGWKTWARKQAPPKPVRPQCPPTNRTAGTNGEVVGKMGSDGEFAEVAAKLKKFRRSLRQSQTEPPMISSGVLTNE